ncbi:MAG: KH domain-containing protein [Blastocatellia bacterium]|nr:KH domain-containing protein [Blastocatellia bacterium]
MSNLTHLVEFLAKSLVDAPDEVHVRHYHSGDTIEFELHVAQPDIGKIIGRQGRTARALRTILSAAASKHRKRCTLELAE